MKTWTKESLVESFKYATVIQNGILHLLECHEKLECTGQHNHEATSEGFLSKDILVMMPLARKLQQGYTLSTQELRTARAHLVDNYLDVLVAYANGYNPLTVVAQPKPEKPRIGEQMKLF